jgi:hypothetical protein
VATLQDCSHSNRRPHAESGVRIWARDWMVCGHHAHGDLLDIGREV